MKKLDTSYRGRLQYVRLYHRERQGYPDVWRKLDRIDKFTLCTRRIYQACHYPSNPEVMLNNFLYPLLTT